MCATAAAALPGERKGQNESTVVVGESKKRMQSGNVRRFWPVVDRGTFEGSTAMPEEKILAGGAIPVKVAATQLPVFPFSGFDLYHHFRNDAFYDLHNLLKVRKTGKREVVLLQPLLE